MFLIWVCVDFLAVCEVLLRGLVIQLVHSTAFEMLLIRAQDNFETMHIHVSRSHGETSDKESKKRYKTKN